MRRALGPAALETRPWAGRTDALPPGHGDPAGPGFVPFSRGVSHLRACGS